MSYKILLAGDGGQGIQLVSDIVCQAALLNDKQVSQIPNFGLEQRGGVSLSYIQISDAPIVYPKFSTTDVLLVLSDQARQRTEKNHATHTIDIRDFQIILQTEKVAARSLNMFFLGRIVRLLEKGGLLKSDTVFELLHNKLSTKPDWEENRRVYQVGFNS